MFIEYPKSLYRGLNDERVAKDATEEKALRAEGYAMLTEAVDTGADHIALVTAPVTESFPKKRGRPAKVANAAE
jgi:hypothetical protein